MLTLIALSYLLTAPDTLADGPVETVADGFQFTEGPVWLPSGELVFSDIPADTIFRADKTIFRKPSGKSNGLALDPQGRLIVCEHWNRRVTRTENDGAITVLAETYESKRFNSPNDAVVRSDGSVFFTDPPYGLEGRDADLPYSGVFRITPEGTVKLLVQDFSRPNGIALSPDERILYVADTEKSHVRAFDLDADGNATNGRLFCDVPGPDGIKTDPQGRLWCTSDVGIRVFAPDGKPLDVIKTPQPPANCAFGDKDGKTLYITARTAVYKVAVVR